MNQLRKQTEDLKATQERAMLRHELRNALQIARAAARRLGLDNVQAHVTEAVRAEAAASCPPTLNFERDAAIAEASAHMTDEGEKE